MWNQERALEFAEEWIEAWNSHDMGRILAHYSDDFEMSSPFIATIGGEPSGTLVGKENVARYWTKALGRMPDLRFRLIEVLFCVNSIAIYYHSVMGKRAVEWMLFNSEGKVCKTAGHYNE